MLCHPHRKMFPVSIWSNRWRHTPYTMSFPGGLNAVDIILTLWVLLRLSTALRYTHHGSKLTRYRHRWQSYWTKKKGIAGGRCTCQAIHWDIKPTFPFFGVNLWQGRNCMPNSAASKGHTAWLRTYLPNQCSQVLKCYWLWKKVICSGCQEEFRALGHDEIVIYMQVYVGL